MYKPEEGVTLHPSPRVPRAPSAPRPTPKPPRPLSREERLVLACLKTRQGSWCTLSCLNRSVHSADQIALRMAANALVGMGIAQRRGDGSVQMPWAWRMW